MLSILRNNQAVKKTLRDNKLNLIESVIEMSQKEDMFTFDRYEEDFLKRFNGLEAVALGGADWGSRRRAK